MLEAVSATDEELVAVLLERGARADRPVELGPRISRRQGWPLKHDTHGSLLDVLLAQRFAPHRGVPWQLGRRGAVLQPGDAQLDARAAVVAELLIERGQLGVCDFAPSDNAYNRLALALRHDLPQLARVLARDRRSALVANAVDDMINICGMTVKLK